MARTELLPINSMFIEVARRESLFYLEAVLARGACLCVVK